MRFFLGTHKAVWLERLDVSLFVSHRTLRGRKSLPEARVGWALDSGGFTELSMNGRWETTEAEYIEAVADYAERIGRLEWAAPQDWMVEPHMVERTGLSVREHQDRTVANYLRLHEAAPGLPFAPVLQGWTYDDYHFCADLYESAGVRLDLLPVVGVGSVCRRQSADSIGEIVRSLAERGYQLHGFGVKTQGLRKYGQHLASADSLAWSFDARYSDPLPGCTHASCSNCPKYALLWRERLLAKLGDLARVEPQLSLF